MKLTSNHVEIVFMDCLYKDGESTDDDNCIKVEGIRTNINFNSSRLVKHTQDVKSMLQCLPDNFFQDKGGGWTFLNACIDKNDVQWTGLHERMEQLFLLAIALNLAEWQLPREMWEILPGGMPYVVIF